MKKDCIKKFFKWFGISVAIIVIIGGISIGMIWRKEIITFNSLQQVNAGNNKYPFFSMTYNGDYGFDDYLKSGAENTREYIKITLNETAHGLGEFFIKESQNCSSFTAIAPNGDRLFARNLDTGQAIPLCLKTSPNNGYKSMSMVNLYNLNYDKNNMPKVFSKRFVNIFGAPYFPLEGMNEHGLSMSVLTAKIGSKAMENENKVTLNDFSIIRMVLDKASTVEEAVEMIKNYNMKFVNDEFPSHFMIVDATGASVVVEYVDGEMQTVYSDKPYQIVTNFVMYNNPKLFGFGGDRYEGIEEKLKETNGILTEKEAMKLLSENTIKGQEQWSAVYNLTQKKAYVCVGNDYETMYEFKFD
ncbi:linear amide C-N hydrolase [Clostridium sp.]|uniref:linear amide C-N hydrolase n=1 Tax=Clostridium sp. TaxID=1506 RepID=UPI0028475991|nr:linear amide C-N hydrolase [Clostridium sp.]MDR3595972.1 linear amide C-N hydrolase [Clostridium sp.]